MACGARVLGSAGVLCAGLVALAGCDGSDGASIRADAVDVRILAHDTSWEASYLVAAPQGAPVEVPTGREVHLPVGASVTLSLASREFICIFSMPDLGLHDFAAPGLPADFHFKADSAGRHELRGDEMCGRPHTDKTRGHLVVEDAAAFRSWVHDREAEARR